MSIKDDLAQKMYAHIKPAIDDITGETQRRHDRRILASVRFHYDESELCNAPTKFGKQLATKRDTEYLQHVESLPTQPCWRCTNCRLFNPTNHTYCHNCYEIAPTAHNVAPAATTFAKAATVADTKD